MKLYINQDEIDFSLENETTLGELYNSLEAWLNTQGYTCSEMRADETTCLPDAVEKWQQRPLEGIQNIKLKALTLEKLKLDNLKVLLNYCQMFQLALKQGKTEVLEDLLKEYSFIESSYRVLLEDHSRAIRAHMAQVLKENGFLPASEKDEDKVKRVLEAFIMLETVIQGRIDEIENPLKAGKDTHEDLIQLLPEMEEVSLLLQTGKDRDAMNIIVRFSELFQKVLRIYSFIPEKDKLKNRDKIKEHATEISQVLKDLSQAFVAEDSVLMGDLVEYEILPRISDFLTIFKDIIHGETG